MKQYIFLAIMVLCGLSGFAQSGEDVNELFSEKEYNHVLYVGPVVGANMTMSSGQPAKYDLFEGTGIGFSGGVAAKVRFGRGTENSLEGTGKLAAGLEVKYTVNNVKTKANDNLKLGYLDIPVLVQFYPLAGTTTANGLFVEAGPDFALLMSKSPKTLLLDLNEPYPGLQAIEYATGDLKGGDLRIAMGLGYECSLSGMNFGAHARYYMGTSELSKIVLPAKLNTFELSLSLMFKVAKF